MKDPVLNLAERMIAIPSIEHNKKALDTVLKLALTELVGFTIEHFEHKGVKSALVYAAKKRPKKFQVLLNVHLDVIPGQKDQYIPRIKGTRLYGAGAMDMKANAACVIAVFKDIARSVPYPLGLQLVTDEEVGGFNGTLFQVKRGVRANCVLASEPTNFDIVHKTKGVFWVKIIASGTTAHGAYPWRGDNAIWKIVQFLDRLKNAFSIPKSQVWATTVNLSNVETRNTSFNKIPDHCSASLDIRFTQRDAKNIEARIRKLLPQGCRLQVLAKEPNMETKQRDVFVQSLQQAVEEVTQKSAVLRGAQGSSDARHFTSLGTSGIEFGPIGANIGGDDEWVDIPSLKTYRKVLKKFLESLPKT